MRLNAKIRKSVAETTYERKIVERLSRTILIFFPITKFLTLSDSPAQHQGKKELRAISSALSHCDGHKFSIPELTIEK